MQEYFVKIEDVESQLGVPLRDIYHEASRLYADLYNQIAGIEGTPHPAQYQQQAAIECSAVPSWDRRGIPSDINDLFAMFQQARIGSGTGTPEMGTLVQAQVSGVAFSQALNLAGYPNVSIY